MHAAHVTYAGTASVSGHSWRVYASTVHTREQRCVSNEIFIIIFGRVLSILSITRCAQTMNVCAFDCIHMYVSVYNVCVSHTAAQNVEVWSL